MGEEEPKPNGDDDAVAFSRADRRALVAALAEQSKPPKRAVSISKKLTSARPSEDERREIFFGLLGVPEMATAIVGVTYLERQLEELLRQAFVDLEKDDDTRMFDGRSGGILGGLAAKIRTAYALGFIGPLSYSDLLLLNDIRNAFAHSMHIVTFNHPSVAADCAALQLVDLDPEYDWSQFAPENLARGRFFMSVVNLYTDLLGAQLMILFQRKNGSLAEHLLRGLKPSGLV